MTTKEFAEWFANIKDVVVKSVKEDRMFFECMDESLVHRITKIAERSDNFLSLHTNKKDIILCLHNHKLEEFIKLWEEPRINKKGIPDMTFVTCKQMADQLKKRENLTFALIWMEEDSVDNFNIEASGNPTVLCGMFTRAVNMAVNWAEKNIHYEEPEADL